LNADRAPQLKASVRRWSRGEEMNQLALALLSISFVSQMNVLACSIGIDGFPTAYTEARAVFIGEVKEIAKPLSTDLEAPLADRLYRVSIKVDYSWKGAGFQEFGVPDVVVLSNQGMFGDCFSWGSFTEGKKYLVYAKETPEKDLIVEIGNRTTLLFKASEDLKELQKMSSPFYRYRFKQVIPAKPPRAEQALAADSP
jgi:hypothetical protein